MDQPSLYDDDIVTWAEQQAAGLRALAARPELSNALDWENLAEEVESVGRSHVQAVESLLVQTLAHLLKRISAPDAPASPHWRQEIMTFQIAAFARYENSMHQRIRWKKVWKSAMVLADSNLLPYGNALLPGLPRDCPIEPDALLVDPFDLDTALLRIAQSTRQIGASTP
ncbi:DUF29 family protein [uncultured Methylobacterium sp.]|uniref:DUF29 family protein n=1 Tax=uncultured Methylobacterium sp. TaxID=157278 RepID=UPI0035CC7221